MITAAAISEALGQRFAPNAEQTAVIESDPHRAMLVVAGAGAGKTETMAARVVWLVANGHISPDRVLGLTFTNKAARELAERIRKRLESLAESGVHPEGMDAADFRELLKTSEPTVLTYDAYAAKIVGEYGLLVPCEPGARVITGAEQFMLAREILQDYKPAAELRSNEGSVLRPDTIVDRVLELDAELRNNQLSVAEVEQYTTELLAEFSSFEDKLTFHSETQKFISAQEQRRQLLPLLELYRKELAQRNLITFGAQMEYAATVAQKSARVRKEQRQRFGVIMLDEYQDTSHVQRILLRELFRGKSVTAVGDPMQSIYGWRGATAANLERVIEDFSTPEYPAQRYQMTTSFRNPSTVLEVANVVANSLQPVDATERSVAELQAHPSNGAGEVELSYFANSTAELEWIATELEQREGSAAVLVRTNSLGVQIARVLDQHGIPCEIIGLAGLLGVPEVADLRALATLLIHPDDDAAAARILGGPLLNLGATDLLALGKWEQALTRHHRVTPTVESLDAPALRALNFELPDTQAQQQWESYVQALLAFRSNHEQPSIGLCAAIATWVETDNAALRDANLKTPKFSSEARKRLRTFHRSLSKLRTLALHYSLADLFAEIEQAFGLRTEVLQRAHPHSPGVAGVSHLDAFARHVVDYTRSIGGDLAAFLDYCTIVAEHDDGFSRGEVTPREDCVQILTIHKAKGLEWDTVAVIGAQEAKYHKSPSFWGTTASIVPTALRGDRQRSSNDSIGIPVLPAHIFDDARERLATSTEKNLQKSVEAEIRGAFDAHKDALKQTNFAEGDRLFYVALTRASKKLYISGSQETDMKQRPQKPLEVFQEIKDGASGAHVAYWALDRGADSVDAAEETALVGAAALDLASSAQPQTPVNFPRNYEVAGAHELADILVSEEIPAFDDSFGLAALWEADVDALIAEHKALAQPQLEVELPTQLSPTSFIALHEDPTDYARRLVRPIPFEPVPFAKRGTAFHQWVEDVMHQGDVLLEEPAIAMEADMAEDMLDSTLRELKDRFRQSSWYSRSGLFGTEIGFQIELGGHTFNGRIDAVYRDPDGSWVIVDWKTGRMPSAPVMRQKELQLALYRLAWAARQGISPEEVKAAFYYVAHDHTQWCTELPSENELADMLEDAIAVEEGVVSIDHADRR
ncbi:MAG: UvrD-helicase domain-containing protein [Corynebacterium sp.]|nr:UvrD-helicase domain-containing protein [Corynebacterium sp.]